MLNYMKKKGTGTILYYILWPLVWVYAPLMVRVRVIMISNGEIAVVKNWFGPNSWLLPGGGIKKTENVVSTAAREIQEELGFQMDVGDIRQLTQNPLLTNVGGVFYRYQYVLCRLDSRPTLTVSHGITNIKWARSGSVNLPASIRSRAL